jgi:hypothetical protein
MPKSPKSKPVKRAKSGFEALGIENYASDRVFDGKRPVSTKVAAALRAKEAKRASKAVKPKMMMTEKQATRLDERMNAIGLHIISVAPNVPRDCDQATALYKRMISCADALYKAAGVR